jgi:RND family efflux transporter MFP subunit
MSNRSSNERNRVMRSLATLLLFAAVLLIATACGSKEAAEESVPALGVSFERIEAVPIAELHESSGSVRSTTTSTISSRMVGNVVSVAVEEGDVVRRGQILLTIDSLDLDAQLRRARGGVDEADRGVAAAEAAVSAAAAQRHLATATYERFEALRARRSVSPQEFDEVEARYRAATAEHERAARMLEAVRARREQALAELASAQAHSSWSRIVAPLDGVVTARHVDPGDQAAPGMPLLEIVDATSYRVDVYVDESILGWIAPGQQVRVRVGPIGLDTTGTVSHVTPAVDRATRSALVKIDLPPDARLRPGLFARAWFERGERVALMAPEESVVRRGQLQGVWVVDDQEEVHFRLVRTGRPFEDRIEILSGLDPGERIVVTGLERLRDGARVTPRISS